VPFTGSEPESMNDAVRQGDGALPARLRFEELATALAADWALVEVARPAGSGPVVCQATGASINGPGGYFGFNLDAFNDCLRAVSDSQRR